MWTSGRVRPPPSFCFVVTWLFGLPLGECTQFWAGLSLSASRAAGLLLLQPVHRPWRVASTGHFASEPGLLALLSAGSQPPPGSPHVPRHGPGAGTPSQRPVLQTPVWAGGGRWAPRLRGPVSPQNQDTCGRELELFCPPPTCHRLTATHVPVHGPRVALQRQDGQRGKTWSTLSHWPALAELAWSVATSAVSALTPSLRSPWWQEGDVSPGHTGTLPWSWFLSCS